MLARAIEIGSAKRNKIKSECSKSIPSDLSEKMAYIFGGHVFSGNLVGMLHT